MSYSKSGSRPGFVEQVVTHTGGWRRLKFALKDHLQTDIKIVDEAEELEAMHIEIRESLIPVLRVLYPGLEFNDIPFEIKTTVGSTEGRMD